MVQENKEYNGSYARPSKEEKYREIEIMLQAWAGNDVRVKEEGNIYIKGKKESLESIFSILSNLYSYSIVNGIDSEDPRIFFIPDFIPEKVIMGQIQTRFEELLNIKKELFRAFEAYKTVRKTEPEFKGIGGYGRIAKIGVVDALLKGDVLTKEQLTVLHHGEPGRILEASKNGLGAITKVADELENKAKIIMNSKRPIEPVSDNQSLDSK